MRRDARLLVLAVALAVTLAATPAVAAGGLTATGANANQAGNVSTTENRTTITVSATGRVEADPDRVVLRLASTAVADDPATATARLAENVTRLRAALLYANLTREQVRTTDYNVFQRQTGEPPNATVRYVAQQGFEVMLEDTNRSGEIVDVAVTGGATEVRDVAFALSEADRDDRRTEALAAATARARSRAEAVAATENLVLVGVRSVTVGGDGPGPVADRAFAAETAAADTEIDAGPVTVTATVRATYVAAPADEAAGNADDGAAGDEATGSDADAADSTAAVAQSSSLDRA